MSRTLALIFLFVFFQGCTKEWLDEKSDKKKIIPTTLEDFQALLKHESFLNTSSPGFLAENGTDDSYISSSIWPGLPAIEQNIHIWTRDPYQGADLQEWNYAYQRIFIANTVLEGLAKIEVNPDNMATWNNLQATALFFRSYSFYQLQELFGKPYNSNTAATDLGIPVRKSADLDVRSVRGTVKETYDQIISDLTIAAQLLPATTTSPVIPGKNAAIALLARVYLAIENYEKALDFANQSLALNTTLIDFSTLNSASDYPLVQYNRETIYYDEGMYYSWFCAATGNTDTSLYRQYDVNDLRKVIYFKDNGNNNFLFRGNYTGNFFPFTGLATDEQYLIRAECYARKGEVNLALTDLNKLLESRYQRNLFTRYVLTDPLEVLKLVLTERRKELLFRGLRWTDLRRLNKDDRFKKELVRKISNNEYRLPPNSLNYTLPIPDNVIRLTGMPNNQRN